MCILSDCKFSSHDFRRTPDHKYRVLYVGNNLALLKFLKDTLSRLDYFVVRAPAGYVARTFIVGEIDYSLFLFDEELPDTTATELKIYTHALHESTPVIIFAQSDGFDSLIRVINRSL